MTDILSLARPELLNLKPYSSARDEFKGEAEIFLDANENPFGFRYKGIPDLNRYPAALHRALRERLSSITGIPSGNIIAGNGSDEIIDLMIRAFCRPGIDSIIITPPTFGIYEVQARANATGILRVPLTDDFLPDAGAIVAAAAESASKGSQAKIVFLCSPNNPTANLVPVELIEEITASFPGLVIVDEAYIEFSGTNGAIDLLQSYSNLMILRTFSKARGMAGARLGIGYSCEEVISVLNKIKLPYNVNTLTLDAALKSLDNEKETLQQVAVIIEERRKLTEELSTMQGIVKVWPSDANFLLVRVEDPKGLYKYLAERGIVVRDRSSMEGCEGCLRITVGRPPENRLLLEAISGFMAGTDLDSAVKKEQVTTRRKTSETDVFVKLTPDGKGIGDVQTGLGFLDHMLELLAFHSGCDLLIRGNGDLHVDAHHLAEDVAITLGLALADAMKGRPVERYGFTLPMDESLATVAVDMGGRAVLVWDVEFQSEMLGDLPSQMVSHFFRSLSTSARCAIHVKASGENDHHIAEAVFKAFGRALRMALRPSGAAAVPSSKGVI
ncbi:MAG: histidinol-phosphate transaminase [Bacteroidales bacterium]